MNTLTLSELMDHDREVLSKFEKNIEDLDGSSLSEQDKIELEAILKRGLSKTAYEIISDRMGIYSGKPVDLPIDERYIKSVIYGAKYDIHKFITKQKDYISSTKKHIYLGSEKKNMPELINRHDREVLKNFFYNLINDEYVDGFNDGDFDGMNIQY